MQADDIAVAAALAVLESEADDVAVALRSSTGRPSGRGQGPYKRRVFSTTLLLLLDVALKPDAL
jgi:hypothetical protein